MSSFDVRQMSSADVKTLLDWAGAEGWNPGKADARIFRAADPEGFIGAYADGEFAAGIAATAYGENYGFIGLYISRADLRGKGYGKSVWNAGMARLSGRTVGLDGVDAQVENYRSKGFQSAYRTLRYVGAIEAFDRAPGIELTRCSEVPFSRIASYDLEVFGAQREVFLREWLSPPHVAIAALGRDGVVGYGAVRECSDGYKVGPLFAPRPAIAWEIFQALCEAVGGYVSIDVPQHQPAFIDLLHANGFQCVFHTTRMYAGPPPKVNHEVFGITTLELG